jgi:glyceraldehyde-3-phosphate dehydrogenase/erythrose-4-phosphate dehydrogenase
MKDWRGGRGAVGGNIIPSSTGAAKVQSALPFRSEGSADGMQI